MSISVFRKCVECEKRRLKNVRISHAGWVYYLCKKCYRELYMEIIARAK